MCTTKQKNIIICAIKKTLISVHVYVLYSTKY